MSNPHPRPWHKGSVFGDGPRVPMCRERRAVWRARLELHRRAHRITDGHAKVGEALITRLGTDGRCDPSHATLAADSAESVSTVKRALERFRDIGIVFWVRRIVREGWRAVQTSNAYLLSLGETPKIPTPACKVQTERETRKAAFSFLQTPVSAVVEVSPQAQQQAREALARVAAQRQAALQASGSQRGGWQRHR
jgi:hypothetical protein